MALTTEVLTAGTPITLLALRTLRNRADIPGQALVQHDLIDPENGSFVIVDRFLRLWIRDSHRDAGWCE